MKKGIAEFIGTFVLVLFGTGAAVLGGGIEGIGTLGIAMAFGLSIVAMAYSIGTISGCHVNPAVSIAMYVNKRLSLSELAYYIVGQVLGAVVATGTPEEIAKVKESYTGQFLKEILDNKK